MNIIVCVYFVIQILILSSIMVLELNLIQHIITISLSCISYLCVVLKKPGYYQNQMKNPSLSDQIQPNKIINQTVIKQVFEQDEDQDKNNGKNITDIFKGIQNLQSKIQNQKTYQQKNQNNSIKDDFFNQIQQNKQSQLKKSQSFDQKSIIKNKNDNNYNIHHDQVILQQKKHKIPVKPIKTFNYCRICKVFQSLRVRHCHECQKCICTFDHHCPWMNNCIGQKNRYIFWIYLLIQFIQFLLVSIDIVQKTQKQQINYSKTYIFAASIWLVTIISLILLIFHTYLMIKNLTTWQYLRWNRIQYLKNYKYTKYSPFSYGFIKNITDYFCTGVQNKKKIWIINPQFIKQNQLLNHQFFKSNNNQNKIKRKNNIQIVQKPQTQRILSLS